MTEKEKSIVLGGGCFWCIEAIFNQTKGVVSAISGYAGGHTANPTYDEVCTGRTGHAEVVKVTYNPAEISLKQILEVFFTIHDPTQLNRQGADVGTQYRSVIFYTNSEDRTVIEKTIKQLEQNRTFDKKIVTEVEPLRQFYEAEITHQDYYEKNEFAPYCGAVIKPKVRKFKSQFPELKMK